MRPYYLNIGGELQHFTMPQVMGIINVTPDSFYSESRAQTYDAVKRLTEKHVEEGAKFIDLGAVSTRPGSKFVDKDEELRRLEIGMEAIRDICPQIFVSVDTFRADVARIAIKELSANIINDISGGRADSKMFETIADLQVPYILMHMRGTPHTMMDFVEYNNVLCDVIRELAQQVSELNLLGVNDIIVDPGFGFSKTLEQNYAILRELQLFEAFHCPILVGFSRKSMVTKLLEVPQSKALNGTTALNIIALERGASILRVHDVAPAVEAVKIFSKLI